MDIICKRCANTGCECVPYDTECKQNFKPKKENENHCYKKCNYFNNVVVCKALQEQQNCYQCIITELSFKRDEVESLRKVIEAYELENQKLKIVLGDKILNEMTGRSETNENT